jgi:hypothetical protein
MGKSYRDLVALQRVMDLEPATGYWLLSFKHFFQALVEDGDGAKLGQLQPVAMHVGIGLGFSAHGGRNPVAEVNQAVTTGGIAMQGVAAIALGMYHGVKLAQRGKEFFLFVRQRFQNSHRYDFVSHYVVRPQCPMLFS